MSRATARREAEKAFKVEIKSTKPRRRGAEPKPITWNAHHLDGTLRNSGFARKEASQRTIDGVAFEDEVASRRYSHLKRLERMGEISEIAVAPAWDVKINGRFFCDYRAHFSYFDRVRNRLVIEEIRQPGQEPGERALMCRQAAEMAHGFTVSEVAF